MNRIRDWFPKEPSLRRSQRIRMVEVSRKTRTLSMRTPGIIASWRRFQPSSVPCNSQSKNESGAQGLLGLRTQTGERKNENPNDFLSNCFDLVFQSPLSPNLFFLYFDAKQKKERFFGFCCFYLRLLRTTAAATSAMIIIAAAMAMYVIVGIPLVGG